MIRFCIVVGLCAAFALGGCALHPHHHGGPYDAPRRTYDAPPPHHVAPGHPHGAYWGPRWH